jgi:hypothetical protein
MLRRLGNGQLEVSVRPPLVYFDHWALREVSSSTTRQDHLLETFRSRGTLMVSLINMVEMAKQGPGPSHDRICRLLDGIGPHWVLTEFDAAVVGEREARGVHPPEAFLAPLDVFHVLYGQLPPGTSMLGAALAQFHDDEAKARAKAMLAQFDLVERLRELRVRHRRRDVTVPNPYPERSVGWIQLELLRYLVKDGKTIKDNDVVDAWHAVVPLRYAHVVLLDGAWVNFASKLNLPDTALFWKSDLDAALDAIRAVDTSRFQVVRPATPRVLQVPKPS